MPHPEPASPSKSEGVQALRELALLDSPAATPLDRLTRLAARILHTPMAFVSLVSGDNLVFKSQSGLPQALAAGRTFPLARTFCSHVIESRQPLMLDDTRLHPLASGNPLVTDHNFAAYLGVPLLTPDGILGTFCVVDDHPRHWTDEDVSTLTDLAASVMTELELRLEVTERQRMIAAFEEKEQFIKRVMMTSPDVIYVYDLVERRNVYSNRHTGEVLGYDADAIRSMGSAVFERLMHPDDLARLEHYFAELAGADADVIRENEYRMRHRSGEWRWMLSRDTIFQRDANGKPTQIIGVAKDITRRHLAEQALESSLKELMILRRVEAEMSETLDLDTVLMIAMDAAMRATNAESGIIGLLEGDRLRIVHSLDSYPAGTLVPADSGITGRVLRTHQPELVLDVTTDPDYVVVNTNTRAQMTIPLLYRDRMIGVLNLETSNSDRFHGAAFDFLKLLAARITIAIDNAQLYQVSQSQLEELAQLYVRVSDLEQSKTNMLRVAAHDLRSPLGLVLGYAELMLEERDAFPEHHREYIESIHRAGEKMLLLINDILSLERALAGKPEQHAVPISLKALAQEVYTANADSARQKLQRYTIQCDDDPLIVRGSAATLREAMTNFIHNAIKYTPPGNMIAVRLERRGKLAAFEVEDTGYGIPQDQQDRLFQPFYRAWTNETHTIEGTGLGLNLVKVIIEKHGGHVYFNSIYGKGSLFGFELAVVPDDAT